MTVKQIRLGDMIDVAQIREQGRMAVEIQANEQERAILASRCEILAVDALSIRLTLSSSKGSDLVKIQGKMDASIQQACSVSLAPVTEQIHQSHSETHTTSEEKLAAPEEMDESDDQPVELIENEKLDMQELVAQWLVLFMDPFPRSADVPFFEHIEQPVNEEGVKTHNPFAVLGNLKK